MILCFFRVICERASDEVSEPGMRKRETERKGKIAGSICITVIIRELYYYFSDFNPVFGASPSFRRARVLDTKKNTAKNMERVRMRAYACERKKERHHCPAIADRQCIYVSSLLVVIPPLGSLFWTAMLSEHYSSRETKGYHVTNSFDPREREHLAIISHHAWNANIRRKKFHAN